MMLSQEVKDQIRKDVENEIALGDAIYLMERLLEAPENSQEYYRELMQEFVTNQKSKK